MVKSRSFSLVEAMVALAVLAVVVTMAVVTFSLDKRDRADWQRQVDDIYAVVNGMELLRRELEVCRQVTHPKASNTSSGRREFLVTVDAGGQVVVYAVVKGNLVAQTMAVASSSPVPDRIVIPRVDRIVFHHRSDVHAVRLQVFMGGVSLVATVRSINDLAPTSFDFDDTYGI